MHFSNRSFHAVTMGHKVVVFDVSTIRALWETRVKKHRARQKEEAERLERSALEKYMPCMAWVGCPQWEAGRWGRERRAFLQGPTRCGSVCML